MKTRIAVVLTLNVVVLMAILVLLSGNARPTVAQEPDRKLAPASPKIEGPVVGMPVYPAVRNIDLRTLPQVRTDSKRVQLPRFRLHPIDNEKDPKEPPEALDPVARTGEVPGIQMPGPNTVFAGLDQQNWGAGWPPDTNGDVGPNHYIQTVNTSIGIYDKTTGTRLAAFTFDTFFTGTSTPCDTDNNGDPIVLYDVMADRWIITDFAWGAAALDTGPYYECIAVSQTGDPVAGGWYMYGFRADDAAHAWLNDYPKLGVWPDAYYMSANMFDCVNGCGFGTTFQGVRVWALDRTSMLSGGPLNNVHFDIPAASGYDEALLPSNLRGNLPPAGTPNFFAALDDNFGGNDVLHIWKFAVNWTTPLSSTFTGPTDLIAAAFTLPASNVPQLGSAVTLDTLGDRLMMQLQYRNINGTESLWANHSVASGGVIGIRWYEIRNPNGTPTIYQQSTYQPDSNYRWMGSLAVDHRGNMAVGYSVSSSSMNPAIRYAGRLVTDTLGTLAQGEATLFAGTGSQSGNCGLGPCARWGDYSAMTIDPTDDCTFWYTTEVYTTTGLNWQTRIGSFKYPSCVSERGLLSGTVSNATTGNPIVGAAVQAVGPDEIKATLSVASGAYSMTLAPGTYTVTASAFGYQTAVVTGVSIVSGTTTTQNLALSPVPVLTVTGVLVSGGDGDNALEPGETANLSVGVRNIGFFTATNASGVLTSTNVQVTILNGSSAYANIAPSATVTNTTLFQVRLGGDYVCGQPLVLNLIVSTNQGSFPLVVTVPTSPPPVPTTYTSVDVPKSVPDNNLVGATSLLTITDNYALNDVDVTLSISHTFDADLDIFLVSPAGITVELSTDNGSSGDNYLNTIFDDEAATSITAGSPPFTGRFRPEGALSVLDGQSSAGVWKLFIRDDLGGDLGTLTAWSLTLLAPPVCDVPTPALARSGQTYSDAGGNNDGVIFPGENNLTAQIGLINNGTLTATNVSGVLTALTPGVSVITNTASYGTIITGAIVTNTTDFGFNVGSSLVCGADLIFGFVANADEGIYDTGTFAFPIGLRQTATYTNNTSLPIPDNAPPVTSTIGISPALRTVADVNVRINMTHTFDADLDIYLISPAGTRVELSTGNGGSNDAYTNTIFDDEAATSIVNGVAPFTGSFRPETPLSALDLQNISGDWKLEIADDAGQDVGTLLNWSLIIQTAKCADAPFLALNKTASATTVHPSQLLTYTLMAQNGGDLASTAVVFSDTLPANVTYVSSSGGGFFSGGIVTWTVGTIPTSTLVTRTVVVQVNAGVSPGTVLSNTFTVLSAELPPQASNSATTTVVAAPVIQVQPSALTSTQLSNQQVTEAVTISNTGTTTLTWNILESGISGPTCIPNDLPWISASPSNGTTAPGSNSPVNVVFDSASLTDGIYTGTLCVISNDPISGLMQVPVTLTVQNTYGVDLSPSQAKSGAPGSTVTYTLPLTNTGSTTNTFTLSAGPHAWNVTIPVTSATLAASAQGTLTVLVSIPLTATTGLSDTVSITASGAGGAIDNAALTTTAIVPMRYIYLPIIRR